MESPNDDEVKRREYHELLEQIRNLPPIISPDAPDPVDVIREIRDHDGRPEI